MFCEKCGNKLNDGDKFCQNCGAVVETVPENVVPQNNVQQNEVSENPVPQNDVQQNEVSENPIPQNYAQQSNQTQSDNNQLQNQTVNNANQLYNIPQPAQPKPKKHLSKKALIAIIASAAAVVLIIAVIVVVSVILPLFNRVNIADYIRVDFDSDMLYEKYAEATVSIDNDELYYKFVDGGVDRGNYEDLIENNDYSGLINKITDDLSSNGASISSITKHCKLEATVKGAENNDDDKKDSDSESSKYVSVTNLGSDDVIVVTLTWDKDQDSLREMDRYENKLNVRFDRSDKQFEIKVKDELAKDDLALEQATEVDLLKYIADNDLTYIANFKDGDLTFSVLNFEYKTDDYVFKYDADNYYDTVKVLDNSGNDIGYVSMEYTKGDDDYGYGRKLSHLSNGDVVSVDLSTNHIEDTNIVFVSTTQDFTVTANTPITVDEAKANTEQIKTAVTDYINNSSKTLKNPQIQSIYMVTPKAGSNKDWENKIVVVAKGEYEGWFSSYKEYYISYYITDAFIYNDKLQYSDISYGTGDKKLADLEKYDSYISNNDYSRTKIFG